MVDVASGLQLHGGRRMEWHQVRLGFPDPVGYYLDRDLLTDLQLGQRLGDDQLVAADHQY